MPAVVAVEQLLSRDYEEFMAGDWEARHGTAQARARFGVWRWAGVHKKKDAILECLPVSRMYRVCDFGGGLGPLGLGARVVDIERVEVWGRPGQYKRLEDMPTPLECFWSSHCIEHLNDRDFEVLFPMVHDMLSVGGHVILNVPSVRGAHVWDPDVRAAHHRIFSTNGHRNIVGRQVAIDTHLEGCGFDIVLTYDDERDNSLVVIARKR